ncbi:MAG: 50S ribosomal protein L18 [Dehalococcoidia bacterium]|nr:50S ribosomal protein L18 [Dehalococcoidia bacterium]
MIKRTNSRLARRRRHARVRKHLMGVESRPRLAVYRSLSHIYAQIVNDVAGHTLVAASSIDAEVKSLREGKAKSDMAAIVGQLVAKRAIDKGIREVVFDRGGFLYHGRVKVLAEAAREAGLVF